MRFLFFFFYFRTQGENQRKLFTQDVVVGNEFQSRANETTAGHIIYNNTIPRGWYVCLSADKCCISYTARINQQMPIRLQDRFLRKILGQLRERENILKSEFCYIQR